MEQKKQVRRMSFWRKLWWFIWEDNSIWSWLANIIIAFILIKFVIYPGLGFLLGTGFPIVAVVSSSMEHPAPTFDQWWAKEQCCTDSTCKSKVAQGELYRKFGISPDDMAVYPFTNGFNRGDIMILQGPTELSIGDILVFWTDNRAEPIIHRIVDVEETASGKSYRTKGDNNCGSANFEKSIVQERMIGKALFRIPFLGWIKIGFVELLKLTGVV